MLRSIPGGLKHGQKKQIKSMYGPRVLQIMEVGVCCYNMLIGQQNLSRRAVGVLTPPRRKKEGKYRRGEGGRPTTTA